MRCVKRPTKRSVGDDRQAVTNGCVLSILVLSFIASVYAETSTSTLGDAKDVKRQTVIQIAAIVPTMLEHRTILPSPVSLWEKGEEILPGATLAMKEINNLSSFLDGYMFELIPIRVPTCEYSHAIDDFVREITSQENNIAAVVGYFCINLAQQLSKLLRHEQLRLLQISAISSTNQDTSYDSNVYSLVSLSEPYSRAAIQLMKNFGWSTVAVVSNQHSNYIHTKELFLRIAEEQDINVTLQLELSRLNHRYLKSALFDQLINNGVKIIIVFVFPSEAVDILCSAYVDGLMWPDYAWIFVGSGSSQNLMDSECREHSVQADIFLNNLIFLHPVLHTYYDFDTLYNGLNYSAYLSAYNEELETTPLESNQSLQSNPYANVLYDSIWAVAHTIDRSLSILNGRNLSFVNISQARGKIFDVMEEQMSHLSFQGVTGFLNFSRNGAAVESSVLLMQVQNAQTVQLGAYIASLGQLSLNESLMGEIPSDMLARVYVLYPIPLTVIITIIIILCFALVTVSMFLFFYYRNEPVIKASSSTLSLSLFIGCYLLLLSSLSNNIVSGVAVPQGKELLRRYICMFELSCFGVGIDVILATVIAKTLRIYHIFKKFGKVHHICSDLGLSVLITSIVSVKILLLIIWTCLDPSHLVDSEKLVTTSVPPYLLVVQSCEANHLTVWLLLYYGYSTMLGLIMVLLAILTRKIKRGNYKDSKKINMFVAVLAFIMCISTILWSVLRVSGATVMSRVVYGAGIKATALSSQSFLILPKVIPLTIQKFKQYRLRHCKKRCHNDSVNSTTYYSVSQ